MSQQDLQKVIDVADVLNRTLHKLVVVDGGIHAETIIAAAARMSGTMLFRACHDDAAGLAPGSPVMSADCDQDGRKLMGTLFATLRQLGHSGLDEGAVGQSGETTALSRLSLAETQQMLEPWYRKVQQVSGLPLRGVAAASAMTTAMLVHECSQVLDIHAGCSIAVHGMVESTRTVPAAFAVPA